jgi:hypothetical protein
MGEDKRVFINTKIKNVMVIYYVPMTTERQALDLVFGYSDPEKLVREFSEMIWETSRHTYKYEVVREEFIEDSPQQVGNFIYPLQHLIETLDGKRQPLETAFDYDYLMQRYEIPKLVSAREIDEVWLMGHPHSGFSEAVMGGPRPLWLTGPGIQGTDNSMRRFMVMGFDYSQDAGAMLEAFIHRSEAIMTTVYAAHPPRINQWQKFTAIDKHTPGKAGVGTAHFAPNSMSDYDWKNNRYVLSDCDDWENYPELKGVWKTVNHTEWGYGSRIEHHKWWLSHLPHGVGKLDGVYNNWWHYIMSPDWVNV